jgi:putative ABC transport system substrate-binding protein
MKRRIALQTLAVMLAARALPTRAGQPTKIPIVGVPLIAAGPNDPIMVSLRRGLSERGYVDGQNIRVEHRFTEGRLEPLPGIVAELVEMKVDILVAGAEPIAKAAMEATRTIPIVVIGWDYDPVGSGLVRSLNKPGGNVTGVYLRVVETVGKRLELLREVLPGLSRVAVLYDSYGRRQLSNIEPAAAALGLRVFLIELREPYDFAAALKEAKAKKVGAVSVLFSPNFYVNRQRLTDAALAQRLPTMFQEYYSVRDGGMISYGPSPTDGWFRAAYFIDRILKGAQPAELPIERPDVYHLAVNMKTAKALGTTIPDSVLLRADEVVR